ncbi:MAG TPA: LolA-related protein [Steroidobacteraceae bacterium]|nr:LolA-related protein [Steroidobacteraceae bacterium]
MRPSRGRCAPGALLLALATLAPAASPPPSAAGDPLDELMRQLAAQPHGHVAFTEVQYLAMLDRPLESSGELLYEAPDRLEKHTLKPRPETLTLAHGMLSATRGGRTRTVELAAHPQLAPLIEGLRATLAGDRAALEQFFDTRLEGDLAHWTLRLTPRNAEMARVVKEVRVSGEHAKLTTVEVLQSDGDRSLLTIGPELPP